MLKAFGEVLAALAVIVLAHRQVIAALQVGIQVPISILLLAITASFIAGLSMKR